MTIDFWLQLRIPKWRFPFNMSAVFSTILTCWCRPVNVRQSQTSPAGSHHVLQLISQTAAENHHSFKQTNQVFTRISHQELDALWTPLQLVLAGGRFFFYFLFFIVDHFLTQIYWRFSTIYWDLFCRCASPSECEQSLPQTRHQEQSVAQWEAGRRETSCALTPMMRALIQLEETRATESRAPCKNSSNTHSMTPTHSQDVTNQVDVYLLYSNFYLNIVRSHNS